MSSMPMFKSLNISDEEWGEKWGRKEIDPKKRQHILKFASQKGHLESNLKVLEDWGLGKDGRRKMALQTYAMVRLQTRVLLGKLEWLVDEFGFTKSDAVRVVSGYPSYLQYSVGESIAPFLCLFKREGISNEIIRKMIQKYPRILGQYKKYRQIVDLMEEHLEMAEAEVISLVAVFPKIFTYSFDKNIVPMVQNYVDVGLTKQEIKNLIRICPSLLAGRDFDKVISAKLVWLQDELGLTKEESLRVLKDHPMTFVASMDCWQESGDFFKSMGIDKSHLAKFFERNYSILGRREPGLREKYEFAKSELKKKNEEIFACPDFFATPFDNSLLLRVAYVRQLGMNVTSLDLPEYSGLDSQMFFAKYGDPDQFLQIKGKWDACSKKEKLKHAKVGLMDLWAQ